MKYIAAVRFSRKFNVCISQFVDGLWALYYIMVSFSLSGQQITDMILTSFLSR
jgi:hypothetical protein